MIDDKLLTNYVLTTEKLIERRVKNAQGLQSTLFFGKKDDNLNSATADIVKNSKGEKFDHIVIPEGTIWKDSEGYFKLWNMIEDKLKSLKAQIDRKVNIAQFPDDYYDLIDMMAIDITRRRMQERDYTALATNEMTNVNYSKAVSLKEFLPYAGAFERNYTSGDPVPLIQQKTGEKGSIEMEAHAIGWERSLEDEIYNLDIFTMQKVMEAVTRGHVGLRNDLCLGILIAISAGAGFAAIQQQPAITTAGLTAEEQIYQTINCAIDRLINLLDPQTGQPIDAPRMVLVCRPNDVRRVNRAINGVINLYRGKPSNYAALTEISEIWPYRGDVIYRGPDRIVYPGIAENIAYLFIPGSAGSPWYTLVKRQLTQEIGSGSVLNLAREQRAWYFIQSEYYKEFLGETGGCMDHSGFVVEITLPDSCADET